MTSEGFVSDLGRSDVAMLRYWFSERTHWLADAFGEPEPLAAPAFDLDPDDVPFLGVDPRADPERRRRDRAILDTTLGRRDAVAAPAVRPPRWGARWAPAPPRRDDPGS